MPLVAEFALSPVPEWKKRLGFFHERKTTMLHYKLTREEKEEYRKYFQDYKLPSGKLPKAVIWDIRTGYSAIFRGKAEMPAINMMPECKYADDAEDKYARILLKCIQAGKPYRYPQELLEEWKKLEELGIPYD